MILKAQHGERVFAACTAGTCLCRSHGTPGRALSLTPNHKTVWKEQETFIPDFWTCLLLPLQASSRVFSFFHARTGRVQCAEVQDFLCAPAGVSPRGGGSKMLGGNVDPELPGNQEQSSKVKGRRFGCAGSQQDHSLIATPKMQMCYYYCHQSRGAEKWPQNSSSTW